MALLVLPLNFGFHDVSLATTKMDFCSRTVSLYGIEVSVEGNWK